MNYDEIKKKSIKYQLYAIFAIVKALLRSKFLQIKTRRSFAAEKNLAGNYKA